MWGKTRAAIGTGYGMPRSVLTSVYTRSLHPETLMGAPYIQRSRSSVSGGKRLVKGSAAAKKRMAYLRSLRGKGSYNKAALRGGDIKFDTWGIDDKLVQNIVDSVGAQATKALEQLALKTGADVIELLVNPEKALSLAERLLPKSWFKKLKNLFGIKDPEEEKLEQMKKDLEKLKMLDPATYEKVVEALRKRQQQSTLQNLTDNILGPGTTPTPSGPRGTPILPIPDKPLPTPPGKPSMWWDDIMVDDKPSYDETPVVAPVRKPRH